MASVSYPSSTAPTTTRPKSKNNVKFINADFITDDYVESTVSDSSYQKEKLPKKTIAPAFELHHPPTLEATLKQEEMEREKQLQIQKIESERTNYLKYLLYGSGISILMLFSLKSWFPILKNLF